MKELVYSRMFVQRMGWYADKVGFIDGEYRGTYAAHFDRVSKLCSALKKLGIGKQDRFAVMALNSHQYLELYHAAFLGAGVINPLNLRLAPTELTYILQDSGTKVIFVDAFFAPLIGQIKQAAGIEKVVLIGPGDVPHDVGYEAMLSDAHPRLPDDPEESDPVVLMYTGGTTGLPKGVLLDQRAEMLNFYHAATQWPLDERLTYLHQTPMFHAASMVGMLGSPLGGTSVFIPVFDPAKVPLLIEATNVNMTVMVPTMIGMMLDHPEFKPERIQKLFPNIELYQGYGMTEASAVLTVLRPEHHREGGALLKSAGRAAPGVELAILDESGTRLKTGEAGEVCARAGNFMIEYWKKPDATTEVFRDGWYHTGDAGYLDERGFLYLVDRVKDMIVTGGENVYSVEVENALATHPAVAQVAVIGIPDEKWGEAVHAIVVPRPGQPLSGAMKVLKRELRAPYWQGRERAVN